MKQIVFVILAVLASLSSYAWDFNSQGNTFTSDVTISGLSDYNNRYLSSDYTFKNEYNNVIGCDVFIARQDINDVKINRDSRGIFFGVRKTNSVFSTGHEGLSIWVTHQDRRFYIKKVKFYYTRLNPDNELLFEDYNVKNYTCEKYGTTYISTFDFHMPILTFDLVPSYDDSKTWDDTKYGTSSSKAQGVFIHMIEIEIFGSLKDLSEGYTAGDLNKDGEKYFAQIEADQKELATTQKELATAQSELATVKENILKQVNIDEIQEKIDQSEHTAYVSRTTAATGGDVNLDGAVNAADVVSVYNYISSGANDNIYNGHRYVDLGLPSGTLWADCNVGATVPEGYGDYFTWAGNDGSFLSGKFPFTTESYKSNVPSAQTTTGSIVLTQFMPPMASELYKDSWYGWRAPSLKECMELVEYCDKVRATINGVEGTIFTSKINHKTLFFPHAGFIKDDRPVNTNVMGTYWTGSALTAGKASMLRTNGLGSDVNESDRYFGRSLRCVVPREALVK